MKKILFAFILGVVMMVSACDTDKYYKIETRVSTENGVILQNAEYQFQSGDAYAYNTFATVVEQLNQEKFSTGKDSIASGKIKCSVILFYTGDIPGAQKQDTIAFEKWEK